MANRRLSKFFAGAVLAFAALAVGGALPAAAATAAPAQPTTAHVTSVPQVVATCPIKAGLFTMYTSSTCTTFSSVRCFYGDQGPTPFRPAYASNGCGVRVWLYTAPHRGGNNLCVSPDSQTGYLQQDYVWVWVSNNPDPC